MKEKFADSFGSRNFVTRLFVRLNICVIEKRFAIFDPREGVTDVGFPGPDRLYFAALEFDAGFVALENMKIAQSLAIKDRLGGHESRAKRAGRLRVFLPF